MQITEKYFNIRKVLTWSDANKIKKLWKSSIWGSLKVVSEPQLLRDVIETMYSYGAETQINTKLMIKRIDGCYARLLRMALKNTN